MTIILKCTCNHTYQDNKYGKNNRIHNSCKVKSLQLYRCTVCGKERNG